MTKEEQAAVELAAKAALDAASEDLKKLGGELKAATSDVRAFAEKADAEIKNLGKMTEDTKAGADKALTDMNGKVGGIIEKMADLDQKMNARLAHVEQTVARRPGAPSEVSKSIGQQVVENAEMKTFMASTSKRGKVSVGIDLATITSGSTSVGAGASPGTSLVQSDRVEGVVGIPLRRLVVRDLITPGQTASSHVDYVVETGVFTPAAATVSEGQTKPYSNVAFNLKSAPVRTIAAMMKASRQILDDAPMLQSYIDGRLRYELQYVEEGQLLLGDGTNQNLLGIIPQATAYVQSYAPAGTEQALDRLRQASLQATLALYPATGYVLHPTNWSQIETLKDSQGRYLVGQPQGNLTKTLWGLPVVDTQAQPVNTFLTGAFRLGAQIFDRMSIEVLISTENADDFERNLISIRGEERLALCVYRPAAFVTGNLP